jgi:hypothetical protein
VYRLVNQKSVGKGAGEIVSAIAPGGPTLGAQPQDQYYCSQTNPASPCFCYRFGTISGIVRFMKKTLLETNSYLKDPTQRKRLIRRSVVSSFAIEGIFLKEETDRCVKEDSPAFKDRTTSTSER